MVKTCPDRRQRLLQLRRGKPLARRGRVARQGRRSSRSIAAVPYVHGIDNGLHESEVDYVIDGDRPAAPRAAEPGAHRRRPCRRAADRGRDRGRRCLQIGIGAMPNAVCSLLTGERRARPRCPHRDAHRRHHRPLPGGRRHRGSQERRIPGKVVVQLRARLADACTTRSIDNPDFSCQPVEMTNLPHLIDAERPHDVDQQHDPDGPPGPGRERVRRPPPHQRHRRSAAVRPRRLRLERRQVVHLHVLDVRAPGDAPQPHRARPDAGQRRHRPPQRRDVRRHRVRDGQPQGQVDPGAGEGDDLDRPSGLPRRPRARSSRGTDSSRASFVREGLSRSSPEARERSAQRSAIASLSPVARSWSSISMGGGSRRGCRDPSR